MRKSTAVKLSNEAFEALENELMHRVKESGNYRLTLKDLASEIILAALSSPDEPVPSPDSEKKVEVALNE